MAGDVAIDRPNVVRSLDLGPDEVWRDYEHKVRKNVKRAKQAGLRVELDPDGRRIEDFLAIYYATLDRREAEEGYYFPRAFFADIIRRLSGQFMFFHALSGEHVVATELVGAWKPGTTVNRFDSAMNRNSEPTNGR